jgi:hypothetical protein
MFAPKVTKPQTKAAESPIGKLTPQHSMFAGHRLGHNPVEQMLFLQRTIGMAQRATNLTENEPHGHNGREPEGPAREAPFASWDFSKVPVFPPGRTDQSRARSPLTAAPPLAAAIQAKLAIGRVDDPLEHEADRVADQVMRMPGPPVRQPRISRMSTADAEKAQAKSDRGDLGGTDATAAVRSTPRSPGRPLDGQTRLYFEPRFGADFSKVRVHDDDGAVQSARNADALAYTVGKDVVFGAGGFAPGTAAGRRLLAHELAHVVQQDGALPTIMRAPKTPAPAPTPLTLPVEGVDMPWIGRGADLDSSLLGYLRDDQYFWNEYLARWPEQLNPSNRTLIANNHAPIVNSTWLKYHPQHGAYVGDELHHHHVGQGSRCVPLPERLHRAYTVFHPQRRTVGSPSRPAPTGGESALPP